MLVEALEIIEEKAFDQNLRDKVAQLGGNIKKLKNPTTREQLKKSIDKVAKQVEKHFNDPEDSTYFNREWKAELKRIETQYKKEYDRQRSDYDSREAYDPKDPKHPDYADRLNEATDSSLTSVVGKLSTMLKDMEKHVEWERNEEFETASPSKKDHESEITYYEKQIKTLRGIIKQLTTSSKQTNESVDALDESNVISDQLAAKKIAAKIVGVPDLTVPKIQQYVVKYLKMVGKSQTDVKYLTALVHGILEDNDQL